MKDFKKVIWSRESKKTIQLEGEAANSSDIWCGVYSLK